MVIENHTIIGRLRTQIERTEMRLSVYSRQYESFKEHADYMEHDARDLQVSIAYLYHTSLSILEQRKQGLLEYCDDVREVLATFEDVADTNRQQTLRAELLQECEDELRTLADELHDIDDGVAMARRHEHELLTDE